MEGIPGSPPSLRSMPSGCPFHPRCTFATDRCKVDLPPLATPALDLIGGQADGSAPTPSDRVSSCWLHDGRQAAPEALALPFPTLLHLPDQAVTPPVAAAAGVDPIPSTTVTHPTSGSSS
jgi:peptide/nickel transport system ATP-binding protein